MFSSDDTQTTTSSRSSSELPIVSTFTRGVAFGERAVVLHDVGRSR